MRKDQCAGAMAVLRAGKPAFAGERRVSPGLFSEGALVRRQFRIVPQRADRQSRRNAAPFVRVDARDAGSRVITQPGSIRMSTALDYP
ncbi:hypothetical protein PWP93_25040 [Paraburkholderia sp. A1RI-2L]|uniref:hypothetical protein n=1 Tax=Paraburkholderia sp. A1RI-2L TaxID=3028367 RepID=UPI003B7AE054